jgi:hypothetical protein
VGVDASVKRDSTAIVACAYDRASRKVRLVYHRIFQPSQEHPLQFEATIEATLLALAQRFHLREVRYDPYQMAATAQRLLAAHVPMVEFPQTQGNLTEASQNFYELVKSAGIVAYPDDEIRLAMLRAVAVEMPRGWKISKTTASHKVDVVVALAMAALGAVGAASKRPLIVSPEALATSRGFGPATGVVRPSSTYLQEMAALAGIPVDVDAGPDGRPRKVSQTALAVSRWRMSSPRREYGDPNRGSVDQYSIAAMLRGGRR